MWIFFTILIFIAAVVIFFQLPGSKTMSEFRDSVDSSITKIEKQTDVFSEEDLVALPLPVQQFFRSCGYLGTPKMSYMKATFRNVDFKLSDKKTIKIDYVQYNFVKKPERFAYIDSSLICIPFEGFDSYDNGIGSMKGTFAKVIPLFNQQGENMNRSCLVTILAECFLVPHVALQDYITWKSIDDTHSEAMISYNGISASGVFTFDENGEVLSFKTSDRAAMDMNGSVRKAEWSAVYSDYQVNNGIRQPKVLKAIWYYPKEDSVYFNENQAGVVIEYY
ncbi:DUF6544 family protein [Paenibacillus donghaensis]|uniref:Uncharacterized protein n=1 Tax=Paenibacillus donghaensis TaxID=414771 RepID=A0A2Z2KIL6_9BACL|nr:DUF6544 family protein [Paenibacillus donghaensis]ASA25757.1 hypothetical protein B9T62_36535 [Paenibacillus donghaensis]